jgi:hypothetical protein
VWRWYRHVLGVVLFLVVHGTVQLRGWAAPVRGQRDLGQVMASKVAAMREKKTAMKKTMAMG